MHQRTAIYLDNSIFTFQKAGGVSAYWYEILRRLLTNSQDLATHLVKLGNYTVNLFEKDLNYKNATILHENILPPSILRYLPLTITLPSQSVFHSSYLRCSRQKDVANVLTIFDFAHDFGFSTGFPRKYFNIFQKRYAISTADGIICISENTKKDLLSLYPHASRVPIKVINLAANEVFQQVTNGLPIDFPVAANLVNRFLPFVVYIGERGAYKNFRVAVETINAIVGYNLVLIGGGALSESEKGFLDDRIPGRYSHLTGISIEQLNQCLNAAFCLLYPSSYEGFGIPLVEAMKAGCPVVTTGCGSIPEVVGNAGLIANSISADAFAIRIKSLEDESFRDAVIQKGLLQASSFSWDKCYAETAAFYRFVHEAKFHS
jgi:glycosyltransferase involved in cell wall biosynthesis